MAIDTIVLKCAAPCNLACTYCYEYSAGDESWRSKPKFLAPGTARMVSNRIREFGFLRGLSNFRVVLHGGEPLLMGLERLAAVVVELRRAAHPVQLSISLQTNGTLITDAFCEWSNQERIAVGVSVDGGERHSTARVDRMGRSTWRKTVSGVELLKRIAPDRLAGVLCVVNTSHEPGEVIDELLALGAPTIDLLQPFLPHSVAGTDRAAIATRFGDWMVSALRHWLKVGTADSSRVRVFDDALQAVCTGRAQTDWFGPRRIGYTIVETDGTYDLLDQLKAIGAESLAVRRLWGTIWNRGIAQVEALSAQLLQRCAGDVLPTGCRGCRWDKVCAAGHLPSRYSHERLFDNPSSYCEGLVALFDECASLMQKHGMATIGSPQ